MHGTNRCDLATKETLVKLALRMPEGRRTPGYDCAMSVTPRRAALLAAVLAFLGGGALTLPRVLAGGPPVGADAPAYCRIARTVVATGSLELPGPDQIDRDIQQDLSSPFGTPYALTRDGRLFPKHSALFGLALAPGTALAGVAGAQASYLLLSAALAALLVHRAATVFGSAPALASFACIYLLVPGGRNLAFGMNLDTVLALAVLAAFDLAARGRSCAAGLLGALSLFLRPTAALLVLPLPFVAAGKRGGAARTAVGLGAGFLAFGAVNAHVWGSPFLTAYGRSAVLGPGGLQAVDHAAAFGTNPLSGIATLVASYPDGLLFVFPLLLLSPLGFLAREARRAEWWVPMAAGAAGFLALGAYDYAVAHPDNMIYRFAGTTWFASAFPLAAVLAWILGVCRTRSPEPRP